MKLTYQKTLSQVVLNALSCIFLLFAVSVATYAQKLPNVQMGNLCAPDNIKIDGKATEWGNKFQAYNRATNVFYTIANDNDNLYLVMHTNDPDELVKITNRGITLNINKTGKKNDEDALSITYPIFETGHKPYIQFAGITAMPRYQREAMDRNRDSVSKVANKKLHDNEKYIRTSGVSGVDTLLSIYNREGIMAAEAFDSTMTYTYELAISLKHLKLPANENKPFAYHIILPGITNDDFGFKMTTDADGHFVLSAAPGAAGAIPKKEHLDATHSTTDFWGEYVLAKKK